MFLTPDTRVCFKYNITDVREKQTLLTYISPTWTHYFLVLHYRCHRKAERLHFCHFYQLSNYTQPPIKIEQDQGGNNKYTSAYSIWSQITTNTHPAIELPSLEVQPIPEQICHCLYCREEIKPVEPFSNNKSKSEAHKNTSHQWENISTLCLVMVICLEWLSKVWLSDCR